jgi:hypothetical protein
LGKTGGIDSARRHGVRATGRRQLLRIAKERPKILESEHAAKCRCPPESEMPNPESRIPTPLSIVPSKSHFDNSRSTGSGKQKKDIPLKSSSYAFVSFRVFVDTHSTDARTVDDF